jgi:hypothetical protein
VGHGVGQYQVWVVGSQLDDFESAYCALSADERFTVGVVADLAKDDIEFLGRVLVVRVHDNSTMHAVCNAFPYAVQAVSTAMVQEYACVDCFKRPCLTFARCNVARQGLGWAKTCMEVKAVYLLSFV